MAASRTRPIITALLVAAGIATLATLVGGPDPAARLVSASPSDGDRLDGSPRAVTLVFNGPVQAGESHLDVTTADGRPVTAGPVSVRDTVMTQPVTLPADTAYRVAYHTVLEDDQQISGEVTFGVNADPPASVTSGGHDHGDWNAQNLGLLAIDLVLVAAALVMMLRGPRVRPDREPARWSLPDR